MTTTTNHRRHDGVISMTMTTPTKTTHEKIDTTTFTGHDFDTQYAENTEKENIPVTKEALPAVGPDMLVYDNDTEMEETVPCLQKGSKKMPRSSSYCSLRTEVKKRLIKRKSR